MYFRSCCLTLICLCALGVVEHTARARASKRPVHGHTVLSDLLERPIEDQVA